MPRRLARSPKLVLVVFVGFFVVFAAAESAGAQAASAIASAPWSYQAPNGPAQWGDLDAAYSTCKTGTRQSPIDIKDAVKAELAPIRFDYKLSPLKIVNNGYTVQINYEPGSSITVNGAVYNLVQFHFHHPSENKIDGQKADMELHLVHRNAEGRIAVVAVLLKSGSESAPIRDLWGYLPKEIGKEAEHKKVQLNAADFLPNERNYYKFSGSITIPPCTEGVEWYVMKQPVEVSPLQIAAFAKLFPDNARPLQATNGRQIQESSFEKTPAQ
ncbi:MAG: carbonic anhydrase family protein [Candidatus Acidiferrales bacterium]